MGWKKGSAETPETTPQVNMALVHEAYMLVRHLRGNHSSTIGDHELVHRLEKFLAHVFDSETTANVLEAFTRSYIHTDNSQTPRQPSWSESTKQREGIASLIKDKQTNMDAVAHVGEGIGTM